MAQVLINSLVIFDVRNNMLSASALFEKGVMLFKIDCFVLHVRTVPQKSSGISGVLRVHNFMACNFLLSVLVYRSDEFFVAF